MGAEFSGPLLPTNHWNASVLDANRVLNTLTGDVHKVRIVAVGRELVATEQGDVVPEIRLFRRIQIRGLV